MPLYEIETPSSHCRWFRHAALALAVCHVHWPCDLASAPCATPAKIEERQSGQAGNIHQLMQVRRRYSQLENVKMFEDMASGLRDSLFASAGDADKRPASTGDQLRVLLHCSQVDHHNPPKVSVPGHKVKLFLLLPHSRLD